jgi:hypothetical protein
VDLSGLDAEFGLEQVSPHALSIADDGCGNKELSSQTHSEIEAAHEELATRIWLENPGVLSFQECMNSKDEDLKTFAGSLSSYEIIDLRIPNLGDGFLWGRYGPKTVNRRFGYKPIFAYQQKTEWQRCKDASV